MRQKKRHDFLVCVIKGGKTETMVASTGFEHNLEITTLYQCTTWEVVN